MKNYYVEYGLYCRNNDLDLKALSSQKADELVFNSFVKKMIEEEKE